MQRIKKAYAESGDLKIIPDTPPLDGSENWEQGRGAYFELDNDPNTGDPLALDIDREQDNYFKNIISKNIKHWQENSYPNWFNDIEYPKNATVKYTNGNIYVSKVANNTALPTNATNWTIYDPSILDLQFVKLTGNQTIDGIKTFTSSPIVPTPSLGGYAVNKDYADLKVALADFTGANVSLASNGYQKLPSGLIIQWGVCANNAGSVATHTLPIQFPNNFFTVVLSQRGTTIAPRPFSTSPANNSQFAYSTTSGSGIGSHFIAIGY